MNVNKFFIASAFVLGWGSALVFTSVMAFSQAQATDTKVPPVVDLKDTHLAGEELGEFEPYEQEYGNLVARGVESFYSEDEQFGIGVWESKPGKMTFTDMEYDELMYVIDGSVTVTDLQGASKTYTKGQAFVMPKGWGGTFEVGEEGMRKIWVSYMGNGKG